MELARPTSQALMRRVEAAQWGPAAAGGLAFLLTVVATMLGARATTDEPTANAVVRGAMVAAPLAVALHASRVHRYERFARLLYLTGLLVFATTLAEARDPALFTVGRTAGWGVEIMLVVLFLAYPGGRLETTADRRLTAAVVATVAVFFLPTLLLAETFRVPSPWTSCVSDCPANALVVVDHQPAAVVAALRLAGAVAVFLVMLAVTVRLDHRIHDAKAATRRMLVPVLAIGMARAVLTGVGIVGREAGDAAALEAIAWLLALSVPAASLAFFVGLVRGRLFAEAALRRLAHDVQGVPDPRRLRRGLADALEEPSTQVLLPLDLRRSRWIDAAGDPAVLPVDDPDRAVYEVLQDDEVIAAIVYDAAHAPYPPLLEAAAGIAAVSLSNLQLAAQADAADRELLESRARIAATADAERRRIERDLHDGAQQRLVALRIELGLLEELAHGDPDRFAQRVRELERATEEALDELRALSHGVCPPLLADRGLPEALEAAATRSPVRVEVRARQVGRYPAPTETAVYFAVLEALQNVAKHALQANRVLVELDGRGAGELRFVVHDDGPGAKTEELSGGRGLLNMRDRIAAVGGRLQIVSAPGLGTTVRGTVPNDPRAVRPAPGGHRAAARPVRGS